MPQVQDLDGGGTIGVEEPPEPIRRNAHRIVGTIRDQRSRAGHATKNARFRY